MSKYPLPISIPKGRKVVLTQRFADTTYVAWYKANGIDIDSHNGADFAISAPGMDDRTATYGARLVCPVPKALLSHAWWENPMSTKGNGIAIVWNEGGNNYRMLAWHCSRVTQKQEYKQEDEIGLIGNSGLVKPAPSPDCPHCGSHLHLGLQRNGELIDPAEIFDYNRWFESEDTGWEIDAYPIYYYLVGVLKKLRDLLLK